MTPILAHQPSTDRWFIVTRYDVVKTLNPRTGRIQNAYKHRFRHDVTDQMRTILAAERAKQKQAAA